MLRPLTGAQHTYQKLSCVHGSCGPTLSHVDGSSQNALGRTEQARCGGASKQAAQKCGVLGPTGAGYCLVIAGLEMSRVDPNLLVLRPWSEQKGSSRRVA